MKTPTLKESITKSLVSVRWDYPMESALKLMEEHNIRHLPVRDQEGALAGILSDRDVKRAMNQDSSFAEDSIVADHMSHPVLSVEQDALVEDAARIMIEEKISSILVTGKNDVVGIVTSEDLLKLLCTILQKDQKNKSVTLTALKYEPIWREIVREVSAAGI